MPFVMHQMPLEPDGRPPPELPGTDYATFSPRAIRDTPKAKQWLMVWANHARRSGKETNPPVVKLAGAKCRFRFTSINKANLATIARLRSAFMADNSARQLCHKAGLHYVVWGDMDGLRKGRRVEDELIDVAYCPPYLLPRVHGFVLDYEVGDDREAETTTWLLARIAEEMAGIPNLLYTNEIDSFTYARSGLQGVERQIVNLFDGFSIMQQTNGRRLPTQAGAYRAPHKLYVTVDLRTNDLASVTYARGIVRQYGMQGVNIWRNGADLADPAIQEKLQVFKSWLPE